MNIKRRIFINTTFQMFGRFLSFFLSFISVFLLTRHLGVNGYGTYSLVFSYLSFFNIISDMGLSLIVVRELSKKSSFNSDDINNFVSIKIFLTFLSIFLALLILIFLPYSNEAKILIIIASFAVSIGSLTSFGSSILQAKLRMDLVAIIDLITKFVTVSFIFFFVLLKLNIYLIVSTIMFGNIIGFILMMFFVKRFMILNQLRKIKLNKEILRESILMGILTFVAFSYFKIDSIILSLYRSSLELGIYSLAYKVIENILIFWGLYMATIYPLMSMYSEKNIFKYKSIFNTTILFSILFSFFCLIVGLTQSELIIKLFGGVDFMVSVQPLKILLFSLPFLVINNTIYNALLAKAKIKEVIACLIISMVFNIILNMIYIPTYGYMAAAYITLGTEMILFILYLNYYKFFYEK